MITFAVLACVFGFLALKSIRTPAVAIVGLLSLAIIEQWAQATSLFFVQKPTFVNFMVGALAMFAFAFRLRQPDFFRQGIPRNAILVLLLFSYALLSTLWTSDQVNVYSLWRSAAPYIVVFLIIGPLLVSKPEDMIAVYKYQIVIGGIFALLVLIGTEQAGRRIILASDNVRANPLGLAQAAGITMICAALMRRVFPGDVIVRLLVAVLCMLAIVRSGSRGQLIGVIAAIAVAYPLAYSIRNMRVFVGSVIGALLLTMAISYGLAEYWSDQPWRFGSDAAVRDVGGRLQRMENLVAAWLASAPAIVFGLGNSASYDPGIIGGYTHLVALEILCELGAIGMFVFAAILINVLIDARRTARVIGREDPIRPAFAVTVGMVAYIFLLSLKQGSLLSVSITQFFLVVMILARIAQACGRSTVTKRNAVTPSRLRTPRATGEL